MADSVRRWPLLAALLAAAAFTAAAFSAVTVRTDMAAFLPQPRTEAARFMLQELQTGSAASVILLGIEGAPPADLARISTALASRLSSTGRFTLVSNGQNLLTGPDAQALFAHRYLLSPATTASAFTTEALRADLMRVMRALQSSASPLAEQFLLPDPTGAFPAMAAAWAGPATVRSVDGVWFAAGRNRALLLAQTRASGVDIGAQQQTDAAIHSAFAAANPGSAVLLESGPAVFARQTAAAIKSDVELLSVVSAALVMALLLWRFRSLAVIAAVCVPVVVSVAVAALAVQAVFGFVHGIALGFGMTMLGVTGDYPVLLMGHRKQGEAAPATLHRIGRAFILAVACAGLGLTGMVFAGFPGLAQLGLFAAVGVVTAALMTWLVLSRLIVLAGLAPVWSGDPGRLLALERLRRWRLWGLLPVLAAAALLLARGGPLWETDIARLSPVPRQALALDADLRRELGAPEPGDLLVVRAASVDAVLQQQEALVPALDRLKAAGTIASYEAAARLLPSTATQQARQAALPDPATLQARLAAAGQGMDFSADAFAPFEQAVAAAKTAPPITLGQLQAPALAARLNALLYQRGGTWYGPVAFTGAISPAALAALAQGDTLFVDIHAETNALVSGGAARALRWLLGGAAAAVAIMLAGLRQPLMVGRIVFAIASAAVVTVALLTLAGVRLSLIHLVALQFIVGIGLDYALFYARRQLDAEERARTLRTLVTCNGMTLLTFGLLALCRTPILQAIGVTVAIGAVSSMCLSFLFVGLRPNLHGN